MTTSPTELERLRKAFADCANGAPASDDSPSPEHIWRAVRGELDPGKTRELVELVARDPVVAEAWRLAREASASMDKTAEIVPIRPARRRRWLPALAAAAVVTVGISVTLLWHGSQSSAPVFRSSPETAISSELEEGQTMARNAFLLRWSGGAEGSTYDLIVSTSDLRILTRAERLSAPEHLVPQEVLTELSSGAPVLWRVEATAPDGRHLSSPTFVQRVE